MVIAMSKLVFDGASLRERCYLLWRIALRHRLRLASSLGLLLPLLGLLPLVFGYLAFIPLVRVVLCTVFLVALVTLCWPWTDYVMARQLSMRFVGWMGCAGSLSMFVRSGGNLNLFPYTIPVAMTIALAAVLAVVFSFLAGVIFVRKRYWPVHLPGHCRHCGFCLFGLLNATCPECGNEFVRDDSNDPQKS